MDNKIIRLDLQGVNAYLVAVSRGFVLFDTGGHLVTDKLFHNRSTQLTELLAFHGCTPGNLKLIILSHGDNDHVANAALLRAQFNAPVILHRDDVPFVQAPTLELMMDSFQYESRIMRFIFRIMKKTIRRVTARTLEDFTLFTPDIQIDESFDVSEYGIDGRILFIPGHTQGSIGLLLSDGSLLSGDALTNGRHPSIAPNAFDFALLKESIHKLTRLKIETVYPGHGEPFHFSTLRLPARHA